MSLFNILLQTGARVADRFLSRRAAPSGGGLTVKWIAVEPHATGRFEADNPDAHDADIFIAAMIRRGMRDEALQAIEQLEGFRQRYPGHEVYVQVL